MNKLTPAVLFAAALFITGCGNKENRIDSKEVFPTDDISKIVMDISSWNVIVSPSDDSNIHVNYSGNGKAQDAVTVIQKNDTLAIQQYYSSKNLAEQFSFGEEGRMMLYLPKNHTVSLEIQNGDGDMDFKEASISDFCLKNSSGYITMSDLTIGSADMESDSGDIKIIESTLKNSDIRTASAYVTLKQNSLSRSSIITSSGEVSVTNVSGYQSLSIETDSADISLSHKKAPDNLTYHILSGSDDVTLQFANAESTADTDGCKKGRCGKGNHSLSVASNSGTVAVK